MCKKEKERSWWYQAVLIPQTWANIYIIFNKKQLKNHFSLIEMKINYWLLFRLFVCLNEMHTKFTWISWTFYIQLIAYEFCTVLGARRNNGRKPPMNFHQCTLISIQMMMRTLEMKLWRREFQFWIRRACLGLLSTLAQLSSISLRKK